MLDGEEAVVAVEFGESSQSVPSSSDTVWFMVYKGALGQVWKATVELTELIVAVGAEAEAEVEGEGEELPVETVPGFCVTSTSCVPSATPP